jgi:hypothetical protein
MGVTADINEVRERVELVLKYTPDGSAPMQDLLRRDFPQLIADLDAARRAAAQVDHIEEEQVRRMVAQARADERAALQAERDTAREALTAALDEQTALVARTREERDQARRLLREVRDEMNRSQIGALMERVVSLCSEAERAATA